MVTAVRLTVAITAIAATAVVQVLMRRGFQVPAIQMTPTVKGIIEAISARLRVASAEVLLNAFTVLDDLVRMISGGGYSAQTSFPCESRVVS